MLHNIQLTTITPVSIGSGTALSPYTDFFISDDKCRVIYLDNEVIRAALRHKAATDPRVIDRYMQQIKNTMNATGNKARVNVQYLRDELGLAPEDFPEHYPAFGLDDVQDPQIKLHETIRNARQPYLAGSTLKGAIKTALLHHWLTETPSGKKQRDYLLQLVENTWAVNERRVNLRDDIALKEIRPQYHHDQDLKDLKREVNNLDREMGKVADAFMQHKASKGKTTEGRDDFSNLLLSDTHPLPATAIEIHKVERLNLKDGAFEMRQLRACIAADQTLHGSLRITPRFDHPDLQFLNGSEAAAQMMAQIRRFSADNLRLEQEQLDIQRRFLPAHIATPISDFLENCLQDLEAPEPHTLLRIGAGKTWYYNAIGLALHQKNPGTFTRMRRLFEIGKPRQEKFPLTKVMASAVLKPLGWVRVSLLPSH
jgi:CRISPR type III-A-associated RAMP protein Csm5